MRFSVSSQLRESFHGMANRSPRVRTVRTRDSTSLSRPAACRVQPRAGTSVQPGGDRYLSSPGGPAHEDSRLVALVVDKDQVIYRAALGRRNVAADEPMTMNTIFNLASMTKPVATTAIMMLVEDGTLSLDDPISRFLPEFVNLEVIEEFDETDGSIRRDLPPAR